MVPRNPLHTFVEKVVDSIIIHSLFWVDVLLGGVPLGPQGEPYIDQLLRVTWLRACRSRVQQYQTDSR